MISNKRWFHAGALTIVLMVVWASSLWANRHYDYSQLDRLSNLNRKSIELMRKGKHQEALKPAEEALRLAKKIYIDDPDHDTVEVMMQNLAFRYMNLGRYSEAEPLFKQILTTDESLTGPNDPEVARSLINLALLYNKMGRDDEAETLRKRALAIYEKTFGPNHPKVAALRVGKAATPFNKGVDYAQKGQYDDAIAAYKEAIRLKPDYAKAHNYLGWAYYKKGQLDIAIASYKEAIRLKPDYVKANNNLGWAYYEQGQFAEAEPLYERALAIREKTLGPDNPKVAWSLNRLANVYKFQGKYAKAEPLYKRALGILEKTEFNYQKVVKTLLGLAEVYTNMGKDDEAQRMLERVSQIGPGQ